jgi:putative transposase
MTRKRHTEEQIITVLKDAQAGVSVQDLCRKHGISDATFHTWRTKYAGLAVSDGCAGLWIDSLLDGRSRRP